jgi:hypothetical protein
MCESEITKLQSAWLVSDGLQASARERARNSGENRRQDKRHGSRTEQGIL